MGKAQAVEGPSWEGKNWERQRLCLAGGQLRDTSTPCCQLTQRKMSPSLGDPQTQPSPPGVFLTYATY